MRRANGAALSEIEFKTFTGAGPPDCAREKRDQCDHQLETRIGSLGAIDEMSPLNFEWPTSSHASRYLPLDLWLLRTLRCKIDRTALATFFAGEVQGCQED